MGINLYQFLCRWVTYSQPNYSVRGSIQIFPEMEMKCDSPFVSWIQSVQVVGVREDNQISSVTFFPETKLSGRVTEVTTKEVDVFQLPVFSFVAINASVLEFFNGQ